MVSGGHARSGPAPDPNALRRDRAGDKTTWTVLARDGRKGKPAPEWPLSEAYPREMELWEDVWTKPQAVMWEQNGVEVEVALYVRRLAEVETFGSAVNSGTLVKQMQESLGLSMNGLMRWRWKIADATEPERPAGRVTSRRSGSARSRFTVIDGD